jgi:hypothetical protein
VCYKSQTFGKITEKNRKFVAKLRQPHKKRAAMRTLPIIEPLVVHGLRTRTIKINEDIAAGRFIPHEAIQRKGEEYKYPWFSVEEMRARARKSDEYIAAGRYITSDELEKRMAAW